MSCTSLFEFFDITWLIALIGMTGAVLNAKQKKIGFYFLIVSNLANMALYLSVGWYGKTFFAILKNLINVWGIVNWTKNERGDKNG